MTTSTIIFFLFASSLTAAPRRVVIVVRPHASGAQFAGAVVGNVIGNIIAARQARRAGVCPSFNDPTWDFNQKCEQVPAPTPVVPTNGPGTALLPGQCPGIAPCAAK